MLVYSVTTKKSIQIFFEIENLRDQVSEEEDARYLDLAKDPERKATGFTCFPMADKEEQKETNKWFQLEGHRVPMRGTKYGLIRSVTLTYNLVKTRSQDYVAENGLEIPAAFC